MKSVQTNAPGATVVDLTV
ncbi:hypothetical protein BST37_02435 [Mycobacterium noviomagense]|uniref:Uncharacterized protein n=1 Tax=Mycobacterium noviomagense TaxID=459858 RepID=A0ABX3TAU9_9MYCO|nr:hypothetical protein BST37_02435 [Mycobacterium noviomagense]